MASVTCPAILPSGLSTLALAEVEVFIAGRPPGDGGTVRIATCDRKAGASSRTMGDLTDSGILENKRIAYTLRGIVLAPARHLQRRPSMIHNGIDLIRNHLELFEGKRCAMLTNACATNANGIRSVDAAIACGIRMTTLFSPEHGMNGAADAGAAVDDSRDAATGLPVTSLFGGRSHIPTAMFETFDMMIADMPDVGVRFYTYPATLFDVMEDCAAASCPVVILDRANPLGRKVEGPVLEPAFASIVGRYPVPIRHGMTLGEYAMLAQSRFGLAPNCRLYVIHADFPQDAMFPDFGLPWRNPSPNLRSFEALCAYPGTCLFEGTNISEGRGTDAPFLIIGAPFINSTQLLESVGDVIGATLKPCDFTPQSSKFAGQLCHGLRIYVDSFRDFSGFDTGLRILDAIRKLYPRQLTFIPEHFDHLMGSDSYRMRVS